MITRDIPKVVHALDLTSVFGCSTGALISGSTAFGNVIDRLNLGRAYMAAEPFAIAHTTWGSTDPSRHWSLGCRLQHGASSAGGGMVDLSTGSTGMWPDVANYMTSVQTTPMAGWSTGVVRIQSAPNIYDIRHANQFLQIAVNPVVPTCTTSTAGADITWMMGGITFMRADEQPYRIPLGVLSTSTSTTT